jgi:AcrR family transcriptional regulator
MNPKRPYTMTARAEAAEATRLRILDAVLGLAMTKLLTEISLDDVASAAGVSVQTVLRRFGNRPGLMEAAREHSVSVIQGEREAPVGDVPAALTVLVDHYELRGDATIMMLAQESVEPQVADIVMSGRVLHRTWVESVFTPMLPELGPQREALVDLLVVATDVYTWKILRRDRGLDRAITEQRMLQLVSALIH